MKERSMALSDILPDFLLPYLPEYTPEALEQLLSMASLGLFVVLALAALCAPLLACITRVTGLAREKAFPDKCAQQMSELSVLLALFLAAVFAGAGYLLHQSDQANVSLPDAFFPLALPMGLALFSGLNLLPVPSLKRARGVRVFLALFEFLSLTAFILAVFALFVGILPNPVLFDLFADAPLTVLQSAGRDFLASPVQWLLLCCFCCAGLAMSAAFALIWFIVRRNKADYGRDYYAYVMRYAASWALYALLIVAASAAGVLWLLHISDLHDLTQTLEPGILIVGFGLSFCCFILWAVIMRSATPMRLSIDEALRRAL